MPRITANAAGPQTGATESDPITLADASSASMNAMLEASNAMLNGMLSLSQELLQFRGARWQEGFEASQRLLGCSDPSAAFVMQCELARSARQQYFDEAAKLMGLAIEVAQSSWAPLETRTKQALGRLKTEA